MKRQTKQPHDFFLLFLFPSYPASRHTVQQLTRLGRIRRINTFPHISHIIRFLDNGFPCRNMGIDISEYELNWILIIPLALTVIS